VSAAPEHGALRGPTLGRVTVVIQQRRRLAGDGFSEWFHFHTFSDKTPMHVEVILATYADGANDRHDTQFRPVVL